MFLVVGPCGSGKSTLIRRLQADQPLDQLNAAVPTVGSNITDIKLGKSKKQVATIRELGGCMSPLWPVYYTSQLQGIIFVIDASDVTQTACSTVLLIELLDHPQLQNTKVLIVFTKADLTTPAAVTEYQLLMRVNDLRERSAQQLTVAVISCLSDQGVQQVADWLKACAE